MEAVGYLVKAEQFDEENIDVKIHLANNYLTLGKPIFAEKALKRALKINPEHLLAKELLKKCL